MNSDIEEIKSRLNVVDVIGEYIRLDKAGANWKARCPFHNEKTPSFMVSADKGIWHCFGCQKGGDIFGFVMEMEGLEFKDTLNLLADKAGVKLQRTSFKDEQKKSRTLEILELATKFYETQLWKGEGKIRIINYLKERGINDESIKEFRLGYAPRGWRNMLTFLTERGYKIEEIVKTGLLVQKTNNPQPTTDNQVVSGKSSVVSDYYDRFRDRIIFPIADTMGKVVGFSARVAPGGDESQAKYVNTPESEVYHKSRALYGIDKAKSGIKKQNFALLVEGNMDVIAASQAGIKNAVAVSGTALTPDQIGIIKRYANNLKMFFDMDKAGEAATKKSLKLCFERDMNVKVVELPEGKDAADLAKSDPEALRQAVDQSADAMEYFFSKVFSKEDKDKAEGKKRIAEEILDMVAHIFSEIEKSHWVKKLSEALDIKESILTDMLRKATLKEKTTGAAESRNQEEKKPFPKTKLEILTENLIGLMFIYEEVWRKAVLEEKENALLSKDQLLGKMLGQGESFQFSFDNLIKNLEDPEEKNRAERIYFEKRYRIGLNNELEETFSPDPVADYLESLKDIRKENRKSDLERIEKDLKAAEASQDREAVMFLRQEVKKISDEIKN